MIGIASIIHASAIRVDMTENSTSFSESTNNSKPKAEALTLVIHKFPPKLRPRVIAPRNDDVVHVYHTSRPKRKPSSRQRRPSSQYRSKIKTKGPASFGGFKDFPPFPTKSSYGEPPRSPNKYKFGPPTSSSFDSYGFNAQPTNKRSKKQPAQNYGPPPNFNKDFDANYNHLTINPSTPFDTKTLQTLQQQQANFPSFSTDTVEPTNNFYASNDFPMNNFPLETGPHFNSQKTSYGNPVRVNTKNFAEPTGNYNYNSGNSNFDSGSSNYNNGNPKLNPGSSNFNSGITNFQSSSNFQSKPSNFEKNFGEPSGNYQSNSGNFHLNSGNFQSNSGKFSLNPGKLPSNSGNFQSNPSSSFTSNPGNFQFNPSLLGANQNSNFPKLPTKYETKDFSTPTRSNPLSANQFLNEFTSFNEVAETHSVPGKNRNRLNNFNKFNNFDYDFKGQHNSQTFNEEDEEEENVDYLFTSTTTTRRPRTRQTTTTEQPILTTKRHKKNAFGRRKRPGKISNNHNLDSDDLRDAYSEPTDFHEIALASDDFINQFDSQRQQIREKGSPYLHEIHSTLKTSRTQNAALKNALGEDFVNSQILSIHKSIEKDPNDVDFETEFGIQRKSDDFGSAFSVGSEIKFGSVEPIKASTDFKIFPTNHRFS